MLKVRMPSWHLKEICSSANGREHYDFLITAQNNLGSFDDIVAGKNFIDFEHFCDRIEDLPDWFIERAEFKPVRPLKLLAEKAFSELKPDELFRSAQVHLPGNELLKIKSVKVEEDCCTDRLQKDLDDGWKIIAVCPQASRRPDYILGRKCSHE